VAAGGIRRTSSPPAGRATGKADFTLDEIGWTIKTVDEVQSDWTGLTEHYRALWQAAGEPDREYHLKRLALLEAAA
jgi:hypothetical protein